MRSFYTWFSVMLLAGCVDSYNPPVSDSDLNYLVVDGFINGGEGLTTIKLSHLMKLSSKDEPGLELNATVTVEGNNATSQRLTETGNGVYSSDVNIEAGKQYRLRIKTAKGKEYLSDFESVKFSPPIDSVTWTPSQGSNGLQTYVATHDDQNDSRYYQWEYEETWQYHADCTNPLDTIPKYTCWRTEESKAIFVSTTTKLSQDVVTPVPLVFVDANSEKIAIEYSILVKQYVISKEAFEYFQQLKKTTEQLGSIFDAQPAQLTGNIHCLTNPSESIIGYIGVHSVAEKRIFILNFKLPPWFYKIPFWYNCPPPLEGECDPSPNCSDCRSRGGTLVKPDFWI